MWRMSSRRRLRIAIASCTALTTLFLWARGIQSSLVLAYFTAINITTMLLYGLDKIQSKRAGYRVPEVTLHRMALCGGTLGAMAGQFVWRHKTRKHSFRVRFIWILVLQITGVCLYVLYT